MKTIELVKEFYDRLHEGRPAKDIWRVYVGVLAEAEVQLEAVAGTEDAAEIVTALAYLQYALDGAWVAFGVAYVKEAAMLELHRSEMTKLGKDGRPVKGPTGRTCVGPDYVPPDFRKAMLGEKRT